MYDDTTYFPDMWNVQYKNQNYSKGSEDTTSSDHQHHTLRHEAVSLCQTSVGIEVKKITTRL